VENQLKRVSITLLTSTLEHKVQIRHNKWAFKIVQLLNMIFPH